MFGISIEHLLILVVVLLIFGPKRLPELGNTMGKTLRNFKDSVDGVKEAQFQSLDSTQIKATDKAKAKKSSSKPA